MSSSCRARQERRRQFQAQDVIDDRQHPPGLVAIVGQHDDELRGQAAVKVSGIMRAFLACAGELVSRHLSGKPES